VAVTEVSISNPDDVPLLDVLMSTLTLDPRTCGDNCVYWDMRCLCPLNKAEEDDTDSALTICDAGCTYYAKMCLCGGSPVVEEDDAILGVDEEAAHMCPDDCVYDKSNHKCLCRPPLCRAGCRRDPTGHCNCGHLEEDTDNIDATLGGPVCRGDGCTYDYSSNSCVCPEKQCPRGCVRDITGQCVCSESVDEVEAKRPAPASCQNIPICYWDGYSCVCSIPADKVDGSDKVEAKRPAPASCQNIPICYWDGQSCVCSIPAAKVDGVTVSIEHKTMIAFDKFSKQIEKKIDDMSLKENVKVLHRIVVEKKVQQQEQQQQQE
jgi:hypothetical protein